MKSRLKIDIPMDKIRNFCRTWKIKEFSVFGSILGDDFRPDSDIDIMVSFDKGAGWSLLDIVEMHEELKSIFGREVDLVEKEAIRNPFRRNSIMKNRKVLHAA
jgi:predicted nucleotidyltransferase